MIPTDSTVTRIKTGLRKRTRKKDRLDMEFFLCVIGMVMIVEGLPYFVFPSKMKEMVLMMVGLDNEKLRKFGFFLMLTGLFIVYGAMKMKGR